jgi:single-strand DNA-binding protein
VNVITLTGRLLDDPARTDTGKGVKTTFWLDVDGRKQLRIAVATWNRLAGTCAAHLRRGRHVAVSGTLEHSSFTTNDGTKRDRWAVIATTVTFLDAPPDTIGRES